MKYKYALSLKDLHPFFTKGKIYKILSFNRSDVGWFTLDCDDEGDPHAERIKYFKLLKDLKNINEQTLQLLYSERE